MFLGLCGTFLASSSYCPVNVVGLVRIPLNAAVWDSGESQTDLNACHENRGVIQKQGVTVHVIRASRKVHRV